MATSHAPPELEPDQGGSLDEISLLSLLQIVRTRWPVVALPVALALAGGAVYVERQLPTYSAAAIVQPRVEHSPFENLPMPLGTDRGSADLGSEMQLLQGETVLRAVADSIGSRFVMPELRGARSLYARDIQVSADAPAGEYLLRRIGSSLVLSGPRGAGARMGNDDRVSAFGVSFTPTLRLLLRLPVRIVVLAPEDAAQALRGSLRITRIRDTNLLQIACTSADPLLAAAIPNATASNYRALSAVRARRAATLRREFLAQQVVQITDSLMAAQQVLAGYQARSRTIDPRTEGEALGEASRAAQSELSELRFKESVLQSLVRALQAPGSTDQAVRRLVAVSQDLFPAGPELYRKLQGFETERGRLTASRYGLTRNAPGVDALDSLIADTKQEMREVAEQSLNLVRARQASADERVRELGAREGELPERATEFARLKQRADAVEKTFDLLTTKYYEAQTAEAMEGGSVDIAQAALVPPKPDPRHLGRTLLLALALGAMVGVFGAFALESLDSSVRRLGDAERFTGLEAIGWIPDFRTRRVRGVRIHPRKAAATAEAFSALRTALRFTSAKVIAVTSPGPGEGKSTVAENLAGALSRQRGSVLLVDADLHRSVLHGAYGIERAPGITDVLAGEATLKQAIRTVGDGLSFLSAGTAIARPGDALEAPEFAALLKTLRETYSWVIVDTPPVLAVAEAATISSLVDGVLVVARVCRTNRNALAQARRVLDRCSASCIGLVLNQVPTHRGYGRYAGPGSYYRYSVYGGYSHENSASTAGSAVAAAGGGARRRVTQGAASEL